MQSRVAPRSGCEHTTHLLTAQEKSVLFSATHLIVGALRGSEKLCSGAQNGYPCAANQRSVPLHISAAATGNAWLGVAAVVTAAPGHVKDLPSCASAQCAVLRFLQYLRFVTAGSCEHLANCHAGDHSGWNRTNRFCSRRLFGLALCGSDRNDFGAFEHARS